jgi:hypothetical protein
MATETEPQGPKQPCVLCKNPIPEGALRCNQCHSYQDGQKCGVCTQWMPATALRCDNCGSYRGWRKLTSVSTTLFAIISSVFSGLTVLLTLYSGYSHRNSNTSISFMSADQDVIYVLVSNTGKAKSTMRAYLLKFGELPIDEVKLVPLPGASSVVPTEGESRIGLMVRGLSARFDPTRQMRFSRDEILPQVNTKSVTLEIDVDESNGRAVRSDSFEAYQIRDLILHKLPE